MGNKKNKAKAAFPTMPAWDWDTEEQKEKWEDFKANAEKLWDQYQDMQKAARKAWKAQWQTFFGQLMGMEQPVADALPDEKVSVPGMPAAPVSPKEVVEKVKELQEKANAAAVEQADNMFERRMQRQQQVKEIVTDAVANAEANVEAVQSAVEEKAEEKAK